MPLAIACLCHGSPEVRLEHTNKVQKHCFISSMPEHRPGFAANAVRSFRPKSQQSSGASTCTAPMAQAARRAWCSGNFLNCYARVIVMWHPYISHKALPKNKLYINTRYIYTNFFFCKTQKYYPGRDTRTLLTEAIGKPQTFADSPQRRAASTTQKYFPDF